MWSTYCIAGNIVITHTHTYLTEDKLNVIVKPLSEFDCMKGGGASSVSSALWTLLLWGSIHRLPASESWGEVWALHPDVIPNMEVPGEIV